MTSVAFANNVNAEKTVDGKFLLYTFFYPISQIPKAISTIKKYPRTVIIIHNVV